MRYAAEVGKGQTWDGHWWYVQKMCHELHFHLESGKICAVARSVTFVGGGNTSNSLGRNGATYGAWST